MRLWLAALVFATSCGPPPSGRNATTVYADELTPAELTPTPTPGEKTIFRVRVYADDAHRAQILNWERKVSIMLRRASAILGPTAGIELEVYETRQWARKATDMDEMLAELEDLDPGGDVHFVLGLTDALPGVTSTIHQLGVARVLGKHVIMRGLNDTKEVAVLEAALEQFSSETRDALYEVRGKHKLTVVFLHELGHALGAIHAKADLDLMAPTYDVKQAAFSKENATLMRIAASFRGKAESARSREPELTALTKHIEATGEAGWIAVERAEVREALAEALKKELEGGTDLGELSDAVRPDHRQLYRDAVRLADEGKGLEAWEKSEALVDFYPDEPAVAVLACRLATARRLSPADIVAWCERAARLAPADISPILALASADIAAKNVEKATELLGTARGRLLAAPGEHEAAWQRLAEAYQQLGMVGLALDAATRSPAAEAIAKWATEQSTKYSVPPLESAARGKLAPTADADYVASVKAALKSVYAREFSAAEATAAAADKRFGVTPGIETAKCDLEIRRRDYKKALAHCKKALALYEPGSWSNYLTGLLDKQAKRPQDAVTHLARAIELDPALRHAYEILASVYDDSGATGEAAALREAFKKRFGSEL